MDQAAVLEGALQSGRLEQLCKGLAASPDGYSSGRFQMPSGVSLNPSPKLQSNGLRQAIVNIIEGCLVNMALLLPTHGLAVEGNLPSLTQGIYWPNSSCQTSCRC